MDQANASATCDEIDTLHAKLLSLQEYIHTYGTESKSTVQNDRDAMLEKLEASVASVELALQFIDSLETSRARAVRTKTNPEATANPGTRILLTRHHDAVLRKALQRYAEDLSEKFGALQHVTNAGLEHTEDILKRWSDQSAMVDGLKEEIMRVLQQGLRHQAATEKLYENGKLKMTSAKFKVNQQEERIGQIKKLKQEEKKAIKGGAVVSSLFHFDTVTPASAFVVID